MLKFNRRHLLQSSMLTSAGFVAGCKESETTIEPSSNPTRPPIALRVLYMGDPNDGAYIERGWSSVSEHPIEIQTLPLRRDEISSIPEKQVADAYKKSDVAIVSLATLSTIYRSELIVPLGDSFSDDSEYLGDFLPAVRNSAAAYAGKMICLPLGAMQLCLVSSDSVTPRSWEEYDKLVESWGGEAAEPTAKGWSAYSFLCRCSGIRRWLFEGETLRSLLDEQDYVNCLEQMVRTCDRYQRKNLSPMQIWSSVSEGDLRGGIAFPSGKMDSNSSLKVHSLPGLAAADRVLLDPFSPVVTLSSVCRQTAIAQQFMRWLSGGEGSESVKSQVDGMCDVRMPSVIAQAVDPAQPGGVYGDFLAKRLSIPITVPSLKLLQGEMYYAILDEKVSLAVSGELSAAQGLKQVCEEWEQLTDEIGREDQIRTWKRINGMRG